MLHHCLYSRHPHQEGRRSTGGLWPGISLSMRYRELRVVVTANVVHQITMTEERFPGRIFAIVQPVPPHCDFLPRGIVNMMDKIATATMNTLNISAIIAAVRTARLSWRP
jgi:hypothetical protein